MPELISELTDAELDAVAAAGDRNSVWLKVNANNYSKQIGGAVSFGGNARAIQSVFFQGSVVNISNITQR